MGQLIIPLVAVLILLGLGVGVWRGWVPRRYWWLFLIGTAIGAIWEFGFTLLEMGEPIAPGGAPRPERVDLADAPAGMMLLVMVIVCVWDGGLFLIGLALARTVLGSGIETRFSLAALGIMQIWGQAQSFAVEIYAIENGFWAYKATRLNPALFGWGEAQITLWPQLVWLIGFFVFYAAALWLGRRAGRMA